MADKIKILHIIKSLGRGGAEMLLPESLKLHDQSKFEFHYIYFLPWKNQMVEAIQQAGGQVTCLSATNNFKILLKAKTIASYVQDNRIQLIHAHLPWAGFVGRWVHRLTNVPLIYTEHNKQERYHFLTKWINRFTFKWQSIVVAVSGDVAESINKNIHPTIPVKLLLNGVNVDFFKRSDDEGQLMRRKHSIPSEAIVVGTVAVFRFQKRLKEWLDVFKEASDRNSDLFGVIVGDGPLRIELEKHLRELNLESRIVMPGLQTEVRPWYSVMNIFMMTSVFEGLPLSLLEAMSMECAVVTTDAGGIKEVIDPGRNGMMEPVEGWKKLTNHIDRLVSDRDTRLKLAIAGRHRIIQSFSMARMVKEMEELYCNSIVLE